MEEVSDSARSIDRKWSDLDKKKYFAIGTSLIFAINTATYPFQLVAKRLQLQSSVSSNVKSLHHYSGTMDAFKTIFRSEGMRGLYRGFWVAQFGSWCVDAIYMTALELARQKSYNSLKQAAFSELHAETLSYSVGGASAEIIDNFAIVPFQVITQRLMAQGAYISDPSAKGYTGGLDAVRKIYQTEGLRGFYRGFMASILTLAPEAAIWWTTYGYTKTVAYRTFFPNSDFRSSDPAKRPSILQESAVHYASGALAACVAVTLINPFDVVKTRLQVQHFISEGQGQGQKVRYNRGMFAALRDIVREEGYSALAKGWHTKMLYSPIVWGLTITMYELTKRWSTTEKYNSN